MTPMPVTTKTYNGSMGRFLEQINRLSLEPILLNVIAEHDGEMSLRQLIRESDFPVMDIMEAIDVLKRNNQIRIVRNDNDEIICLS
jgi:hypothetical protein